LSDELSKKVVFVGAEFMSRDFFVASIDRNWLLELSEKSLELRFCGCVRDGGVLHGIAGFFFGLGNFCTGVGVGGGDRRWWIVWIIL
jgi:hypothetical protein